jgi:hypothetical protein
LCGKRFRAITHWHLWSRHGFEGDHPIEDYKQEFALKTATCGEMRKKRSETRVSYWDQRGQHWTSDMVLDAIRRRHRGHRSLRSKRVPVRLNMAARRHFGSWGAAVEKAGLNYEATTGFRRWTREKVIDAIHKLAARGVPLASMYVRVHHYAVYRAAVKAFPSSWADALAAAGFDPAEHKMRRGRWDRPLAEVFVRKQHAKGRSLLAQDMPKDLVKFVHRRLRMGWGQFVESLGLPFPGIRKRYDWTKAKLVEEIGRWKAEGHRMNCGEVVAEYQALAKQARKYFGSWDKARAAAGV